MKQKLFLLLCLTVNREKLVQLDAMVRYCWVQPCLCEAEEIAILNVSLKLNPTSEVIKLAFQSLVIGSHLASLDPGLKTRNCFIPVPVAKLRPAHHKYYLIMKTYTWPQGQNYCRETYNDIATVITKEDWLKLNQEAASKQFSGYTWIGLYNGVNGWIWSDGTEASNLPWASGEPRTYNGFANCVSTQLTVVNSYFCSTAAYFFCHTIIPMRVKQIIKLQVKSDGSIFDPAVQSSVLEQMKQKLEDNLMLENTTVTWRVQPDGNIFYKKNKNQL